MLNRLMRNISPRTQFLTNDDINKWIEKYLDIRSMPYPCRIVAMDADYIIDKHGKDYYKPTQFYLLGSFTTIERDGARPLTLSFITPFQKPASVINLLQVIRAILVRIVVHEVDEAILVDEMRVFDPHNNDTLIEHTTIIDDIVEI